MAGAELNVIAALECSLGGESVAIVTEGRQIVIDARTLSTLVRLARLASGSLPLRAGAKRLKSSLDAAKLSIESRVDGEAVARIGFGIEGSLSKFFGLPAMQLNPLAVAKHSLLRPRKDSGGSID